MLFREDKVARADAEAIRKGVGFYRWTHDLVEITGKDALAVLQKIYISDISKVAVGRSKYTASLDETGEIIDDVIVMHMAEGVYWVSDLYGPRLLPWIEQHKGEADIHAKIITYDWDMYAVQGPDSLKAMNAMLDAPATISSASASVSGSWAISPFISTAPASPAKTAMRFILRSTRARKFTTWRSKPSSPSAVGSFRRSRFTSAPSRWKRASRSSRISST